ncbi:peroxiredoxin-like family protein [Nocardioides coralli]|uniref:peroxiredoxin-like family protein n=1 Tax=Nocardioides coralli TaxID=2872154 RepID=UPI001CA460BF|nr:peroxiredoxin-like family protein [Nocardioides coralli]QZY29114.1 AhpC/TSA family protein [Nocardioides coralli]
MITPQSPAPALDLPLVSGGRFRLSEQQPEAFTMIVFYRGLHCPVCRKQLSELDRRLDDLRDAGLEVVAVSGDDEDRARRSVEDWRLDRLPVAYGQDVESMREWGLFVSKAVKDGEPDLFGEPGMFLVKPDGTVFWQVLSSMPFARPHVDDVLAGVSFVLENDYPARGEA